MHAVRHWRRGTPLALLALLAVAACSDSTSPPEVVRLTSNVPGLSFGVKEAGEPDVVRSLTITNEGTASSAPLEVTVEGTGAEAFRLDSAASSCIDIELSPDATCSIVVKFGGAAAGPQSASLFVDGGGGRPRIAVTLNGVLQATLNAFARGNGLTTAASTSPGSSPAPTR